MTRNYQAIGNTWFEKGKQYIIPTYGKHEGVKLLGVLNYETGRVHCVEEQKYDAEVFLRFLKKVLELYPTCKIVIILNNTRVHHAKLLEDFLEENKDRLQLVFLPSYSPKLNLIEGLWGWLKDEVINKVFYRSVKEIRKAVQGFISSIIKEPETVIRRLCLRM